MKTKISLTNKAPETLWPHYNSNQHRQSPTLHINKCDAGLSHGGARRKLRGEGGGQENMRDGKQRLEERNTWKRKEGRKEEDRGGRCD